MKTPYNPDSLPKDYSPQRTTKLQNESPSQNDLPQASPIIQQLSQQLQNMQISNKMPQNNVTNLDNNDQTDRLREITNNFPENQFSDYKFVFTVPQLVDPDPITCILESTADQGAIYLGNFDGASNVELLKKHKIRAVLTASIETGVKYDEEVIHFHEIIQAHDKKDYDLVQHFEKAYDFIDRNRKFTNIFVHCFLGVSRSASLLIAYLMKKYNMNFEKALWTLKSKRRQVNPNIGFVKQLKQYEQLLQKQPVPKQQIYQPLQYPTSPIGIAGQSPPQQQQMGQYPLPSYYGQPQGVNQGQMGYVGQTQQYVQKQQSQKNYTNPGQYPNYYGQMNTIGQQGQIQTNKEMEINPRNSFYHFDQQYFQQQQGGKQQSQQFQSYGKQNPQMDQQYYYIQQQQKSQPKQQ